MEKATFELLQKLAKETCETEQAYLTAKHELDILKAQFVLKNDWEEVLGKSRPTVAEKEAYIALSTEEKEREVNQLKVELDYSKKLLELSILEQKY